jgi:hypothetical protein
MEETDIKMDYFNTEGYIKGEQMESIAVSMKNKGF